MAQIDRKSCRVVEVCAGDGHAYYHIELLFNSFINVLLSYTVIIQYSVQFRDI